ncbi:NAD(P)-dependent oxidoreductase [Micromonospora sp. DR5-3]|uniref:NAD-dependent epimerase/dehydratase family protein n=1 Tax=unclassified Micromonospora TaxID=2617518 RepID=UPI0011D7C134|nr:MULTISPECIES: NAD(P)-dependent oxidoreductase [unclassified Micromonospora]MCW3815767.1 NAD(P)-dependent oxidoreductase [Micromonospora sp. DR5-3]TYC21053.1 NAD(P)-dependent oxidoreductase [Micromonospora sp. MP36]
MKVLVTGGSGTVGLSLVEALLGHGIETVVYALAPPPPIAGDEFEARGSVTYELGDVLDGERLYQVLRRHDVDVVVHAAAMTPDPRAELTAGPAVLNVNCAGSLTVVMAASRARVRRVVHVSSIAAYGTSSTTEPLLLEEATPDRPETLYELSKFTAEKAVLRVGPALGTEVVSARIGDVFGRWEHRTTMRATMSAPFQVVSLALAGGEARLPRPGRKPWVYSVDVAEALRVLVAAPVLDHCVYNVSSPFSWGVDDWCALAARAFPSFRYRVVGEGDSANVRLFGDNAPMSLDRLADAGYTAKFDLARAFSDYVEWIRHHRPLLDT